METKVKPKQSGIPTTYAGVRFRSRLEATWACMFDLLEWKWEYEPLEMDSYIPDFVLRTNPSESWLVEVKPEFSIQGLVAHSEQFSNACDQILMLGATPFLNCEAYEIFPSSEGDNAAAYWCHENYDQGKWVQCPNCNRLSIFPTNGGWMCLCCGKWAKHWGLEADVREIINALWNTAKNRTQWRKRGA